MAPRRLIAGCLLMGFVSVTNGVIFKGGGGTGTSMTEPYGEGWIPMGNNSAATSMTEPYGDGWIPMGNNSAAASMTEPYGDGWIPMGNNSAAAAAPNNASAAMLLQLANWSPMTRQHQAHDELSVDICKQYCPMTGLWGDLWTKESSSPLVEAAHTNYEKVLERRQEVLATKVADAKKSISEGDRSDGSGKDFNEAVDLEKVLDTEKNPSKPRTATSTDGWVYIAELVALGPFQKDRGTSTTTEDGERKVQLGQDLAKWGIPHEDHPVWQEYTKILQDIKSLLDKEELKKSKEQEKKSQPEKDRAKETAELPSDVRGDLEKLAAELKDNKRFSERGLNEGELVGLIDKMHTLKSEGTEVDGPTKPGEIKSEVDILLKTFQADEAQSKWLDTVQRFCIATMAYGTQNIFGETPVPEALQNLHASAFEKCVDGASGHWLPVEWNFKEKNFQAELHKLKIDKLASDAATKTYKDAVEKAKSLQEQKDYVRAFDQIYAAIWDRGPDGKLPVGGQGHLHLNEEDAKTLMKELEGKLEHTDSKKESKKDPDDVMKDIKSTAGSDREGSGTTGDGGKNPLVKTDEGENDLRRRGARTVSARHSKEWMKPPTMKRLVWWAMRPIRRSIRKSLRS